MPGTLKSGTQTAKDPLTGETAQVRQAIEV